MRGGPLDTHSPDTSLAGDSESRNLPLLIDVTTTGEAGPGYCATDDTGREIIICKDNEY